MRKAMMLAMLMAMAMGLTGCASVADAGWQGRDAAPFDAAKAQCDAEATAQAADGDARTAVLEACMQAKGWTRPAER